METLPPTPARLPAAEVAGVEIEKIDNRKFDGREQARAALAAGGQFLACGTCLKFRDSKGSELCPISTLQDLYAIVRESDRLLTF